MTTFTRGYYSYDHEWDDEDWAKEYPCDDHAIAAWIASNAKPFRRPACPFCHAPSHSHVCTPLRAVLFADPPAPEPNPLGDTEGDPEPPDRN